MPMVGMGLPPFAIKARVQVLRDMGASQAPFNSWNTLRGIETLSLRMDRHCRNAQPWPNSWKDTAPSTGSLSRPQEPPGPRAGQEVSAQGRRRHPGLWHQGRRAAGQKFIDHLKLFSHLANVGDAKSLAIHPATTTHSQLDRGGMATAGVTPDFIRLSVGLEDIEDILVGFGPGAERGVKQ
jgi:O-acetylhomoserine (thiol)-lyase